MGWVLSTSHNDPNDKWVDPTLAYNGNTADWGRNWDPDEANYLELILGSPISCDKVRIRGNQTEDKQAYNVNVEVYYSGAYHKIMDNGSPTIDDYTEVAVGSTQTITKAKIWKGDSIQLYLREFSFWEIEGWSGKVSGVTNPAKVLGVAKANISKVMGVA